MMTISYALTLYYRHVYVVQVNIQLKDNVMYSIEYILVYEA